MKRMLVSLLILAQGHDRLNAISHILNLLQPILSVM